MSHDVYRLFDDEGALLYVGESKSAEDRVRTHRFTQPWGPKIANYTFARVKDSKEAKRIEKELIKELLPLYNLTHNPLRSRAMTAISECRSGPSRPWRTIIGRQTLPEPVRVWKRRTKHYRRIPDLPLPTEFDELKKTYFAYSKDPEKIGVVLQNLLQNLKDNSLAPTPTCQICGEESTWLALGANGQYLCQMHTWKHDYIYGDPEDMSLPPSIRCNPYNYVTEGQMRGHLRYRVLVDGLHEATSLAWRKI